MTACTTERAAEADPDEAAGPRDQNIQTRPLSMVLHVAGSRLARLGVRAMLKYQCPFSSCPVVIECDELFREPR